jgi:hypothetical protein
LDALTGDTAPVFREGYGQGPTVLREEESERTWKDGPPMVKVARYEEKQYETALIFDLAAGSPFFFPSGQALEKTLGYDFAIAPAKLSIWDLLRSGIPPGIVLTPNLWAGPEKPDVGKLPTHAVSLIVQAKRPELVDHWRGGQYAYWRSPYFRFFTDHDQQGVLVRLEEAVSSQALVRYACGAFLEYDELLQYQQVSEVAERSTFVSPALLRGHRLWSYPGAGTVGYANPEGEPMEADSLSSLLLSARGAARPQRLSEHFYALAEAVQTLEEPPPPRGWAEDLTRRNLFIEDDAVAVALAWATVASVVARVGGSWLVLGFEDDGASNSSV